MSLPVIKLLVGGQNSGKSTWIAEHFDVSDKDGLVRDRQMHAMWRVISRDTVRENYVETFNLDKPEVAQVSYQGTFGETHNEKVNAQYYDAIRQAVQRGENILIDATNTKRLDRDVLLSLVDESGVAYRKEALLFETSVEEALRRNEARDETWAKAGKPERKIPDFIIRHTYEKYEKPSLSEGFDCIREVATPDKGGSELFVG